MIVYAIYPLAETRVQREAEALLKHGYEVDVICMRLPNDLPIDFYKGVRIYREKYRFPNVGINRNGLVSKFLNYTRFFLSAAVRVTQLHIKNRYDVIQVHNLPDYLVFCAFLPKLFGVPIILDLHDLMPEFFAGRFKQQMPVVAKLISWQEHLACKFSNHVITVSEHWRHALIKRGVPEQKCSVIMNVADENIFSHSAEESNHRSRSDQFRLIYHGSIHERYGLDLALIAIDHVRKEIPNIHLTLIGYGEFLPHVAKMVEELDLSQHVTIEDLHLAEELPGIILSNDLGVVPYQNDVFTDGLLPTKLMEYAALGMPAIASSTTTIQEYFTDTNVEFFEPGNADDLARVILYLYNNPIRLEELSRGSQKFNEHYNWSNVGAAYVSLVEEVRQRNGHYHR